MWVLFDLNGTLVDPAVLLEPAAPGSASWQRTVAVAGRRPRVRPVR